MDQKEKGAEDDSVGNTNQYPLDSKCYEILDEIGRGVSAIVYKAICIPLNSSVVAIKAIDLEKSRADLDSVRRESKIMTLLCHPNILRAHCSFTVESQLWVVMPFISCGSLQSIISSSFPDGLPEPCIATVLKETLSALAYLHGQGHLHRDIKAGNILMDSNGSVKLADFGVSASVYERSSSSMMLTDMAGTPYWMAPEVIHSHTGYSFKADIWSFGITAMELAHGRPPLSDLPPFKSLIMKITKRFRFSDHSEKGKDGKPKKFSKSFKDMVALCLDQDPSKRPSAEKLLKHSFFKNCKGSDYFVKNVLQGLESVEQRYKGKKMQRASSFTTSEDADDEVEDDFSPGNQKQRRISGWNFNEEGFELEPVFKEYEEDDKKSGKRVSFGAEPLVQESFGDEPMAPENISNLDVGQTSGEVDKKVVMDSLLRLMSSLDRQREQVVQLMVSMCGEESTEMTGASREELIMEVIDELRMEVENEKKKRLEAEMEVEFLKLQIARNG